MRLIGFAAPLALIALGAAAPAAARQFEGVVTIKTVNLTSDLVADQTGEEEISDRGRDKLFAMTMDQLVALSGSPHSNVMHMKGGRMRTASFDMPGLGSAYMLLDLTGAMMRPVAPAKRGYYETSLRGAAPSTDQPEPIAITPLGRTQVINGTRCTGYRVTQGDQLSHVWTTDDPSFRQLVTGWLNMV